MINRSKGYLAVSGLCVVIHNVIITGGDRLGWSLAWAVLASYCVVTVTGYVLHCRFTFHKPLRLANLARYAIAMSANIPLAYGLLWFWHVLIGLDVIWASPLATACMLGCNYCLSGWAIRAQPKRMAVK
ncbi:MAG: GtrA family protein [Sphingomonadales bacterium]|nr:GtrA family protein [Sphingomonadales bacterium]